MAKKIVVVVDMQKDFIDGALGSAEAVKIVDRCAEKIKAAKANGDTVIFTRDTHGDDYLDTQEGHNLKVPHCINLTEGWLIDKDIRQALVGKDFDTIEKKTFGSEYLADGYGFCRKYDEVVFVGTCTDICVISNVLTYKAFHPEIPLVVYADLCAGLTPEKHEAALNVMQSCQVDIRYYTEGK